MGSTQSTEATERASKGQSKGKVAIIGGGPGGAGVSRALVARGFDVDMFESQDGFGGVWKYTGKGPMYRDLDTNIVAKLMEYKDFPFKGSQGYRDREDVYEYVVEYSKKYTTNVHFNTTIANVLKDENSWRLIDIKGKEYEADFVVLAAGHYNVPFTPEIEGIEEWRKAHPGTVLHSRTFDNPDVFENKKVVVVGNGASGLDVAIQILSVTAPVSVCRRHEAPSDVLFDGENMVLKPELTKVDAQTQTVYYQDGSSDHADVILFCTGYLYEFPFLKEFSDNQKYPLLHPRRQRLCNLYERTFYLADPTLAVVGMDKQIVPMPVSETQGAVIARVFAKDLTLPPLAEMVELERRAVEERGDGQSYHNLGYPNDAEWMAKLDEWVDTVPTERGFTAEKWDSEKLDIRKHSSKTKLGEFRHKIDESNRKRLQK